MYVSKSICTVWFEVNVEIISRIHDVPMSVNNFKLRMNLCQWNVYLTLELFFHTWYWQVIALAWFPPFNEHTLLSTQRTFYVSKHSTPHPIAFGEYRFLRDYNEQLLWRRKRHLSERGCQLAIRKTRSDFSSWIDLKYKKNRSIQNLIPYNYFEHFHENLTVEKTGINGNSWIPVIRQQLVLLNN